MARLFLTDLPWPPTTPRSLKLSEALAMLIDTLYLTLQLAKIALLCAAAYSFTWFMLAI